MSLHSMESDNSPSSSAALVVAHPGHELRIYNWVERHQPLSFILTDGSGYWGERRIDSSTRLLLDVGASIGSIYGRFTDLTLYDAFLKRDFLLFRSLMDELTYSFIDRGIRMVVGDAIEGYSPVHDICRTMINLAVHRVQQMTGVRIHNYEFPIVEKPDSCLDSLQVTANRNWLDSRAFLRKLQAARLYTELADELDYTLSEHGPEMFQIEYLRPAQTELPQWTIPWYEKHGECQVQSGRYTQVVRYRSHFLPIVAGMETPLVRVAA